MRIFFIRHAEGYHNLSEKAWNIKFPRLTEKGKAQANNAKKNIPSQMDLILVSPLIRTLETSDIIFKSRKNKFISEEFIKEKVINLCDYRQPVSEVKDEFNYVDFSNINDDYDFNKHENDISERLALLYDWILSRNENNIAVVSHGQYLYQFINKYGDQLNIKNKEWMENCEVRTGSLKKGHSEV
jgi:broad specificity phosphatase PhoE